MAIFQDPSTPALTSGFGNAGTVTTLQSPGFSPPAGSLIVVLVAFDYLATNPTSPAFTVTDSVSGVYTPGPGVYDTEFNRAQIWYRYVSSAPGSITVTVTNSGPQFEHGWIIAPYVLDGASPSQAGAASGIASSASTSQVPWSGTVTATSPGSWVLTVVAGGNTAAITALTGTTTLSDTPDVTEGATYLTGRNTTVTALPGAVTPGWAPGTGSPAYDYAWAALEILAASIPLGLPPLSVKRFPYRRAVVGRGGSCGGGVQAPSPAVPVVTAFQPRPFVARRTTAPARAVAGPRPQPSGGIASPVVTPQGAPSSPPPRPVIVHLPPHRAKVGPGTYLATGRAGVQTPLGFQAQPAQRPVIVHVPPARARVGLRGQAAGGVLSAVVTPLGSPSQPAPRPVIQHVPPHRVVWRGLAALNFPSAVALYRPRPFVWRSPAPARARLGNNVQAGDGAYGTVTPQGSPSSPAPRPVIQHVPGRRAWVGGDTGPYGGVTGRAATSPGAARPLRPFVFRSPAPARARLGNNLQTGAGAAGVITPQGSPSSPPPRPVIVHVPPHRVVWRGGASRAVTPLGSAWPAAPVCVPVPGPGAGPARQRYADRRRRGRAYQSAADAGGAAAGSTAGR